MNTHNAPIVYTPALDDNNPALLTLHNFLGLPVLPCAPPGLLTVSASPAKGSSLSFTKMRIHMQGTDVPYKTHHGLGLYVHGPLMLGNRRYIDKQCNPYLVNEGDVVDAITYNLLTPLLEPLNQVVSSFEGPWKGRWVVELKAQVSGAGARCDHYFVARHRDTAYQQNYPYNRTTLHTQGTPVPGEQYVLLVVEEKRRQYLRNFFNNFQEDTVVDLSASTEVFEQATYAQLLKYSNAYQCVRLFLTDYESGYGMMLERVVNPTGIVLERTDRRKRNLARLGQATRQTLTNSVFLEEPDVFGFHWMVHPSRMRHQVFELCLMGLNELGLCGPMGAQTERGRLHNRRPDYREYLLTKARDDARLQSAARDTILRQVPTLQQVRTQITGERREDIRARLVNIEYYLERRDAAILERQDFLHFLPPAAYREWLPGLSNAAVQRYLAERGVYQERRRAVRPRIQETDSLKFVDSYELGEPRPPSTDDDASTAIKDRIRQFGGVRQQKLRLEEFKACLADDNAL